MIGSSLIINSLCLPSAPVLMYTSGHSFISEGISMGWFVSDKDIRKGGENGFESMLTGLNAGPTCSRNTSWHLTLLASTEPMLKKHASPNIWYRHESKQLCCQAAWLSLTPALSNNLRFEDVAEAPWEWFDINEVSHRLCKANPTNASQRVASYSEVCRSYSPRIMTKVKTECKFWGEIRGSQGRGLEHRSTWGFEHVKNWE